MPGSKQGLGKNGIINVGGFTKVSDGFTNKRGLTVDGSMSSSGFEANDFTLII